MTAVVAKHRGVEVRERLGIKLRKKPVARFAHGFLAAQFVQLKDETGFFLFRHRQKCSLWVVLESLYRIQRKPNAKDQTGAATTTASSYSGFLLRLRVTPRGTAIVPLPISPGRLRRRSGVCKAALFVLGLGELYRHRSVSSAIRQFVTG